MLALYHFGPVANSLTPLLCLLEKGAAFESRLLDSRNWEHHSPEFRALNPDGTVPVLVHDGRVVRESTVINEYLDEILPDPPLRPDDPWQRARMRVLTKYVDEHFCPALTVLGAQGAVPFAARIGKAEMARRLAAMPNAEVRRKWETISAEGYPPEELADARRRVGEAAARLEAVLADGREWLLGEAFTLADMKWFSMARALPRILPESCEAAAAPRLAGWLERMEARPAVRALADYGHRR